MNNPYLTSAQAPPPTGERGFAQNFSTYGIPFQQTTGVVAGNTERLLRVQIGEWSRLILEVLAWCGMIGFVALLIWLVVIIALSPNSPPIEAVQLLPGFVSIIACGWALMMLETSGRIKFYIYGSFSLLFLITAFVIIILWYVYYTSFIFTCNDPDPATLAVFLCQSGVARNTEYAAFAFDILGTMMVLLAIMLNTVVLALAPPKGSDIRNEMSLNYWRQAAQLPSSPPLISMPDWRSMAPLTLRRRGDPSYDTVNSSV